MTEPTLDEQIAAVKAAIVEDGTPPRQIKRAEIRAILASLWRFDALKRRADSYESECRRLEAVMTDARAKWIDTHHLEHITDLQARVRELERDAARLDWLQQKSWYDINWWLHLPSLHLVALDYYDKDIRAAIDATLSKERT